jgi:phosphohistidine phosphatase SixA
MSAHGRHQIETLARALRLRGTLPELFLTSEHAKEAGTLLSERLANGDPPVVLDALTPGCGPGGIDELVRQAQAAHVDLDSCACVLAVGHEGRLSDLLTELTGARSRPLSHGEGVCVRGASLQELAAGRGAVHYRYPTANHQEEALRAKVHSKMTVATFLAGFVFTALSAVLVLEPKNGWPWDRVAALVSLTTSLALFIAAVYIYDQLGTPSGFWTDADRPRAWRRLYRRREARLEARWANLQRRSSCGDNEHRGRQADDDPAFSRPRQDGPVYWLMVRTSRFVFTPAVVLALAGFIALLVGTGDRRIWAGGLVGLAVASAYAAFHRPDLGAD